MLYPSTSVIVDRPICKCCERAVEHADLFEDARRDQFVVMLRCHGRSEEIRLPFEPEFGRGKPEAIRLCGNAFDGDEPRLLPAGPLVPALTHGAI